MNTLVQALLIGGATILVMVWLYIVWQATLIGRREYGNVEKSPLRKGQKMKIIKKLACSIKGHRFHHPKADNTPTFWCTRCGALSQNVAYMDTDATKNYLNSLHGKGPSMPPLGD